MEANKTAEGKVTAYAIKRVDMPQWRHADPINGEWWGPLEGAFTFGTMEAAIKYGGFFTGGEPFQIYPVEQAAMA